MQNASFILDVWQNARKVRTVMPPEKGHRSAYPVLYDARKFELIYEGSKLRYQ